MLSSRNYDQVSPPALMSCFSFFWLLFCVVIPAFCMTDYEIRLYRNQTVDLFYHGYTNYLEHAFPEDELRPVSCTPLTRDRANPAHIELNDVLGNYSLTLIDSLSTLAIIASSTPASPTGRKPLLDFQDGVSALIGLYGDGSDGSRGQGTRSRGFDLDSKVQVFETVIRGVGGLLSAHLFAVGDLPIRGYNTVDSRKTCRKLAKQKVLPGYVPRICWPNGFVYDGQLLRLAHDLGTRLLPAFYSDTGLPYPRVNLRYGVPFYANSPLNVDAEFGRCLAEDGQEAAEITETCSAGAGSLVLEFSTLSRLIGNPIFEKVAKEAFLAVWERRSILNLIGSGIDAETGNWVSAVTGNGAGVDSYFEYAVKSHILFSGAPVNESGSPDFLGIWREAHAGIKHHLYRGRDWQHPHYVQGDLFTGAARAFWIDSLSAFYPGLLVLDGKLDEAIETHMLWVALWTRYSAIPERWSVATGNIESGLRWWGGRPEFTESTWYLYQATKDPWYLHVGEMVLRDIQRRCWTECGWAGLEDVRTGELKDRMESFFLGETAKYLYLLFDPKHPLNTLDSGFVFSTEGHPLILPKRISKRPTKAPSSIKFTTETQVSVPAVAPTEPVCPSPAPMVPFSISYVASRSDLFHASQLARLPSVFWRDNSTTDAMTESSYDSPNLSLALANSRNNLTFYPWTLPQAYIPTNGTSAVLQTRTTFDLSFPTVPNAASGLLSLQRIDDGIMVHSTSALKLSMVREKEIVDNDGGLSIEEQYRVYAVGHINLGRNEKLSISANAISHVDAADPYFTRHRDVALMDLVLENDLHSSDKPDDSIAAASTAPTTQLTTPPDDKNAESETTTTPDDSEAILDADDTSSTFLQSLLAHFSSILNQQLPNTDTSNNSTSQDETYTRLTASIATGIGAGQIPDLPDVPPFSTLLTASSSSQNTSTTSTSHHLFPWTDIFVSDTTGCTESDIPKDTPHTHQILVLKRGDCSFHDKLKNIPAFTPSPTSLQLVIIVSYPDQKPSDVLIRPLVDSAQQTPRGIFRRVPVPLVMVDGGDVTLKKLRQTKRVGLRRRYWFSCQGIKIGNLALV